MFVPIALAGMSLLSQRKGERAAKESQRVQRAEENISNAAAARQRYRQQRVMQAQIRQASVNSGVADSSGEIGSIAAMNTNQAAMEASVFRRTSTADTLSGLAEDQARASRNANLWGTFSSIAMSGAFNGITGGTNPGAGLDVFDSAQYGFDFAGDPFQ